MQIILIGSGNVAHVMGRLMKKAGHTILQVWGRRLPETLAQELGAVPITGFSTLRPDADLYVLALSDDAIPATAACLPQVEGIVVHTAGALPLQVLAGSARHYGVLYPLQTLRKEKTDYDAFPLLVDGHTPPVKDWLLHFAATLSNQVAEADDADRLKLHTAAVVVSNFTNHLYALAADFCRKEQVDFRLLQPLVEEVAGRMRQFEPASMQTGPAIRGDEATIYRHLQLLEGHPSLQELYRVLTRSIRQTALAGA